MSIITVSIPEEDFVFLQSLTASSGTTPEEFLAKQTRLLRERMQRPLHPDVIKATGVIKGDIDARKEYYDYLGRKHA